MKRRGSLILNDFKKKFGKNDSGDENLQFLHSDDESDGELVQEEFEMSLTKIEHVAKKAEGSGGDTWSTQSEDFDIHDSSGEDEPPRVARRRSSLAAPSFKIPTTPLEKPTTETGNLLGSFLDEKKKKEESLIKAQAMSATRSCPGDVVSSDYQTLRRARRRNKPQPKDLGGFLEEEAKTKDNHSRSNSSSNRSCPGGTRTEHKSSRASRRRRERSVKYDGSNKEPEDRTSKSPKELAYRKKVTSNEVASGSDEIDTSIRSDMDTSFRSDLMDTSIRSTRSRGTRSKAARRGSGRTNMSASRSSCDTDSDIDSMRGGRTTERSRSRSNNRSCSNPTTRSNKDASRGAYRDPSRSKSPHHARPPRQRPHADGNNSTHSRSRSSSIKRTAEREESSSGVKEEDSGKVSPSPRQLRKRPQRSSSYHTRAASDRHEKCRVPRSKSSHHDRKVLLPEYKISDCTYTTKFVVPKKQILLEPYKPPSSANTTPFQKARRRASGSAGGAGKSGSVSLDALAFPPGLRRRSSLSSTPVSSTKTPNTRYCLSRYELAKTSIISEHRRSIVKSALLGLDGDDDNDDTTSKPNKMIKAASDHYRSPCKPRLESSRAAWALCYDDCPRFFCYWIGILLTFKKFMYYVYSHASKIIQLPW